MTRVQGIVPVRTVETRADTNDLREAVRRFREEHPDAQIETVNGRFVRGLTVCGLPVFFPAPNQPPDTPYAYDPDTGMYRCPSGEACSCHNQGNPA